MPRLGCARWGSSRIARLTFAAAGGGVSRLCYCQPGAASPCRPGDTEESAPPHPPRLPPVTFKGDEPRHDLARYGLSASIGQVTDTTAMSSTRSHARRLLPGALQHPAETPPELAVRMALTQDRRAAVGRRKSPSESQRSCRCRWPPAADAPATRGTASTAPRRRPRRCRRPP